MTVPGDEIVMMFQSRLREPGWAYPDYRGGLRTLHAVGVGEWNAYIATYLYASPILPPILDRVDSGRVIGLAQDLQGVYPKITNHCHIIVQRWNGATMEYVNPETILPAVL